MTTVELLEKRVLLAAGDVVGQMFAGDLNGDGKDELIVVNDRFVRAWEVENGVRTRVHVVGTLPDGAKVVDVGDSDGDGTDDLVVQTRDPQVPSVDSLNVWPISRMVAGAPVPTGQLYRDEHAAGLADLDGDGTESIIIEDARIIEHWEPTGDRYQLLQEVGRLDWINRQMQAADVDDDGDDDLIFANRDNGTVGYWQMSAGAVPVYVGLGTADLVNWQWLGTANTPEGVELVWLNRASGALGAWRVVEGGVEYRHIGSAPQGWGFVTLTDFNGDGYHEQVWQERHSGAIAAWDMPGTPGERWSQWLAESARQYNPTPVPQVRANYVDVAQFYHVGHTILVGVRLARLGPVAAGDVRLEVLLGGESVYSRELGANEDEISFVAPAPRSAGEYVVEARLTTRYGATSHATSKVVVYDEAALDELAPDYVITAVRYQPGAQVIGSWLEFEVDVLNQGGPGKYNTAWFEWYKRNIGVQAYMGDTAIGGASGNIPGPGETVTMGGSLEFGNTPTSALQALRLVVGTTSTPEDWRNNEWVGDADLRVIAPPTFYSGDFDGDGIVDVLVNNTAQNRWETWLVRNGVRGETHVVDTVPGTKAPRIGDFNGDGTDDLLVEHPGGPLEVWLISQGQVIRKNTLAPGAFLRGIGDVNGDGADDLVWSIGQGVTGAWIMKDGLASGWQSIGQAGYKAWGLLGLADLNGDGFDDFIWSSDRTNTKPAWEVGTWLMGASGPKWVYLGSHEGGTFTGTGDFDGIGTADLMLQGYAWMNARDLGHFVHPSGISGGFGSGDVNGDGKDDVLWTWPNGVAARVYLMDGPNWTREMEIGSIDLLTA